MGWPPTKRRMPASEAPRTMAALALPTSVTSASVGASAASRPVIRDTGAASTTISASRTPSSSAAWSIAPSSRARSRVPDASTPDTSQPARRAAMPMEPPISPTPTMPRVRLDIEAEVDDVAVLDDVVPPLQPLATLLADGEIRPGRDQLLGPDHLSADEATGKVGVDDAGGLQGGAAALQRPGAHLLLPGREEGEQVEEPVGIARQPVEARLGQPQGSQELAAVSRGQLDDLGLDPGGDGQAITAVPAGQLDDRLGRRLARVGLPDVDHHDQRAGGEQEEVVEVFALLSRQGKGADRLPGAGAGVGGADRGG